MARTALAIGIFIGVYLVLYCLEYAWNLLFRAPLRQTANGRRRSENAGRGL